MNTAAWAFEGALHLAVASWQAAAVAAIALAFARLAPRAPAGLRGGLLAIAAIKFCIPPMLPMATGIFSRAAALPAGFPPSPSQWPFAVVCGIVVLAHLAGWGIRTGQLFAEYRRLRVWRSRAERVTAGPVAEIARDACRRAGLVRIPEILVSPETGVPCAFGVRRPAICLPSRLAEGLSAEHLSLVMLHEALHLRRRDPLANLLDAALASFWWFHPGAHLLARSRRRIREERCDRDVLRARPGAEAPYSRALVAAAAFAARRPARTLSTGVSDGPEHLASRIRALVPAGDARPRRILTAAALATAALVFLPGVRPNSAAPVHFPPAGSVRP